MAWARFTPDHMVSLEALEKEYAKELAGEDEDRVTYLVEEKETGRPLGSCVMRTWDRKHVSTIVGILMEKGSWGQGLGTEAMLLLLAIAFDAQGWHRAALWTLADNERAIRSFERCGFRLVGVEREATYSEGHHRDVALMELLKSEWDAQGSKGRPPRSPRK